MAKKRRKMAKAAKKGAKKTKRRKKKKARAAHQSSISNDVDDCVKRAGASRRAVSARRDRTSMSPAPVDDRGRRRDRVRASSVSARRRREDRGNGSSPYLAAAYHLPTDSQPRPLADALGIFKVHAA